MEPFTLEGDKGLVTYLNDQWLIVDPAVATLAKVIYDDGRIVFYHVRGKDDAEEESRTLGDLPGHEFHGNQWTDKEPPFGKPGTVERFEHIAWEHGKNWRSFEKKLETIRKKDPKTVNWSKDWQDDTRTRSISDAEDEIELFKEKERKALDYVKKMRASDVSSD